MVKDRSFINNLSIDENFRRSITRCDRHDFFFVLYFTMQVRDQGPTQLNLAFLISTLPSDPESQKDNGKKIDVYDMVALPS